MKFSLIQLQGIFAEAQKAAVAAGQAKLAELHNRGPAFGVHNADVLTGRPIGPAIGQLYDVCGFAYCLIPKRVLSLRSKAVKQLVASRELSNWDYYAALSLRLPHIDQAMSVNEAAADAAAAVLKRNGLDAYTHSRID